MDNIEIEYHPLKPFLPEDGTLLMLGSFPPQQKRWCMDWYYPNFTNDMWRVFGLAFFDDPLYFVDSVHKTYKKDEIISFLSCKGIGIFDTASAVRRLQDNASDKFLEVVISTDIEALLAKMPLCRCIVTTGQKATDTLCQRFSIEQPKIGDYVEFDVDLNDYYNQSKPIRRLRLYRMPSTSRAYPLSLRKKADLYKRMFESY